MLKCKSTFCNYIKTTFQKPFYKRKASRQTKKKTHFYNYLSNLSAYYFSSLCNDVF